MESLLAAWLEGAKPGRLKGTKRGRTKASSTAQTAVGGEVRPFRSAGDVLGYGVERSWVVGNS